jgi:lysophospholipase L1-like esterase
VRRDGGVTIASERDELGTSRRYAQALLEHVDATKPRSATRPACGASAALKPHGVNLPAPILTGGPSRAYGLDVARWGRRALAVAVALGGALALPMPAGAAVALEWSVPERLRDIDRDGTVDPAIGAEAHQRAALVRLRVGGAGDCRGPFAWRLDGDPVTPAARGGCEFELTLPDTEPHELELEAADEEVTEPVQARDALVVSIGDSIASGEGNPDRFGPRWLEPRCHRSMRSGAAQAAIALERGDPHTSVTFVPLGCSGATIDTGLLREYDGVDPDRRRGSLPAQVAELRALDRRRPVDAVVVSVGANDIHFGPLVQFCIRWPNCIDRRFNPAAPLSQPPKGMTARETTRGALGDLLDGYRRLAAALEPIVPPERVAILEYFDPLTAADGDPCPRALGGVEPDEVNWARGEVLAPLNAAVRRAAADHGWVVVRGVASAFRTHGVCVRGRGRWVVLPEESFVRQWWITGTLHPNEAGHQASAVLIVPVLAAMVGSYGGAELTELITAAGGSGGVAWFWLIVVFAVGALVGIVVCRRRSP